MSTTYETDKLVAGKIFTDQKPFDADTYYRGELLELDTVTGRMQALATGDLAGVFLGTETTLANGDYDSVITSGELYEGGIVDDDNEAVTLTEAQRVAYAARGFIIKRV